MDGDAAAGVAGGWGEFGVAWVGGVVVGDGVGGFHNGALLSLIVADLGVCGLVYEGFDRTR